MRARISAAMKAEWAKPEQRARRTASVRAALSKPGVRARISSGVRAALATPEVRARLDWLSPEQIAQLLEAARTARQIAPVARQWLISAAHVYRLCRRHGVPTPAARRKAAKAAHLSTMAPTAPTTTSEGNR
jgi:DNA-binding phage protein